MMRADRVILASLIVIVLGPPGVRADDPPADCSPLPLSALSPVMGPRTLSVQGVAFEIPNGRVAALATIARGLLPRGKRNHVLLISATLSSLGAGYPPFMGTPTPTGGVAMWPAMVPSVNGIGFFGDIASVDCGGSGQVPVPPYCTLTATWIADLDRLEVARPGRVFGKPLCVELNARDFSAVAPSIGMEVTLNAVVLRK